MCPPRHRSYLGVLTLLMLLLCRIFLEGLLQTCFQSPWHILLNVSIGGKSWPFVGRFDFFGIGQKSVLSEPSLVNKMADQLGLCFLMNNLV